MRALRYIFVLLFLIINPEISFGQYTVTPATGGEAISADDAVAPVVFTELTGPVMTENAPESLPVGETIILRTPAGYIWDVSEDPVVTVELAPGQNGNTNLEVEFNTITSREARFTVTNSSAGGGNSARAGEIIFSNLWIRPSSEVVPNEGIIRNTGTTTLDVNASYGDLEMVPGDPDLVRVETEDDGSGDVLPEQTITVTQTRTGFAIVTDQSGNFIDNAAADSWEIINVTGTLLQSALTPSGDNRNAVFSSEQTGSGQIRANIAGLTSEPSGVITVNSGSPSAMIIDTQPSATAEADVSFPQQPVIHVVDGFGNLLTQSFQVNAEKNSGPGSLNGTKQLSRSNGVFEFSNLSASALGTIDILFSGSGLTNVISNQINVTAGSASGLVYAVQPSNALENETISPAIEVQLVDNSGNTVEQSGITVSLSLTTGTGSLSGTTSQTTNGQGRAVFSNISINQLGTKRITASSTGLSSVESNQFNILEAGQLSHFLIEANGGGNIGTQTAGNTFQIQISARDALNDPITGNDYNVEVESDANITGGAFTVNLTDGSAENISLALETAGEVTITANLVGNTVSGESNVFTLQPTGFHLNQSEITANPEEISANGISQSQISVILRDEFGNQVAGGGETVVISSTAGTLDGSVSDNGDGTYTQNLTSSTTVEQAEVSATVNGSNITSGNAFVDFIPGTVTEFEIELQGGGDIPDHNAGETQTLVIRALDDIGNVAQNFTGQVNVTSAGTFSTGGGTTTNFTNGVLNNYDVAFSSTGSFQINVQNTNGTQTGSSNSFTVSPGNPSTANSTVTASPTTIENNGTSTSDITVTLLDGFGNQLNTGGDNVIISTTAGTIGGVSDNGDGTYSAILTSSTNLETATISATVNGNGITDQSAVQFVEVNTWVSTNNPPGQRTLWDEADNWTLGIPTANQAVVIPTNPANGQFFPTYSGGTTTIAQVTVQSGATLTVSGGSTLNINGDVSGQGTIVVSNSTVTFTGDKLINNLNAGTSTVTLNGSVDKQVIENTLLADDLNFNNTSGSGIEVNGVILTFENWNIDAPVTLSNSTEIEARNITINNTLNANESSIRISEDLVINGTFNSNGISLTTDGTVEQNLGAIGQVTNLTIESNADVNISENLNVTGSLVLDTGVLVMEEGAELLYGSRTLSGGQVRMSREISGNLGWRMIGSPLASTVGDFLSGVYTQGFTGADNDAAQPNFLWYDETFEGTDNQRWRTPGNATDLTNRGRGYFLFVFGNNAPQNQTLPVTLEFAGTPAAVASPFNFGVTYTAEADTGWNLIANPYTSTINWDHFTWQKDNVDNVVYIWDSSANGGDGEYLVWNGISGSLGNGLIAPMQSFWIKADENPDLRVNPAARTTGGAFYSIQEDSGETPPAFSISAQHKETGRSGQTWFTFTQKSSTGKDKYDAYRLQPMTDSYVALYSLLENKDPLVIQSLPMRYPESFKIPLVLEAWENGRKMGGEFDLFFDEIESIPSAWQIILRDDKNGAEFNIRKSTSLTIKEELPAESVSETLEFSTSEVFQENAYPSKITSSSAARFTVIITPDKPLETDIPEKIALRNNYPNPFNSSTTIPFEIPDDSMVRIEIFDILGRRVQTLYDGLALAGYHSVNWNAREVGTGVYFIRMSAGEFSSHQKMLLIR